MFNKNKFFSRKRNYLFGLLVLLFIFILFVAFRSEDKKEYEFAKREILLRRIGHEILLQSGDSISRVLPIHKVSNNEYQIRFEKEFTFEPDSLLNITNRFLNEVPSASNYIVNVLNCNNNNVTYGYAISDRKKDNIIACIGRKQPKACYIIDIRFNSESNFVPKKNYFLGGLFLIGFLSFIFFRSDKSKSDLNDTNKNADLVLGTIVFDVENKKLIKNEETIDLTGTETRLLRIFAFSPNEVIERSRLQKEIWEDEGVIVGRSLDMFISKLRKKLELDQNLRIVVVRGKGYKLEINPI